MARSWRAGSGVYERNRRVFGRSNERNPACRFCNTLMAQVKTPTWATCPQSVCKKHGVMGCEGDSVEDLGGVNRGRYSKHNARVEQIGITSACEGRQPIELGRFMFHDGKCGEELLLATTKPSDAMPILLNGQQPWRATWPTCRTWSRWGIKMDHCEMPLAMYQLPTKRTEKNRKTNQFPEPRVDNVA